MRKNYILLVYQFGKSMTHSSQSFKEIYYQTGEDISLSDYSYHPNRTVNACEKITRNHLKDIDTPVSQLIDRINDHQT